MDAPPNPRPRWYSLTPDRIVIGLLVLECLLWLSQRLDELTGTNRHKGWGVVTVFTLVLAATVVMLAWFIISVLLRRTFQFSVRSLLLAAVVVAIPSSWLATELRQARIQHNAVVAISKLNGKIYEYGEEGWPQFLRDWFGDEFFGTVSGVTWYSPTLADADLINLERLPDLEGVFISSPLITDVGLKHLKGLRRLRELSFWDSQLKGNGIESLSDLTRLLIMNDSHFTDAGIASVVHHKNLDALYLDKTAITDAGLEKLRSLSHLTYLTFKGTNVTAEAETTFRRAHPNCTVNF
jgi:hypothetical protein